MLSFKSSSKHIIKTANNLIALVARTSHPPCSLESPGDVNKMLGSREKNMGVLEKYSTRSNIAIWF